MVPLFLNRIMSGMKIKSFIEWISLQFSVGLQNKLYIFSLKSEGHRIDLKWIFNNIFYKLTATNKNLIL